MTAHFCLVWSPTAAVHQRGAAEEEEKREPSLLWGQLHATSVTHTAR